MKQGSVVRVVQPVIQGTVISRRIREDNDDLEFLVEWTDAAGATVQRWFDADQLEIAQ